MICVWHIQKNVLANCKKHFSSGEEFEEFLRTWNELMFAKTLDDYESAYGCLASYKDTHNAAFLYVSNTWLPLKERFVACMLNIRHFGSSTTSRAEGSHHAVKSYI